jgi:hypothetical protein
MRDSLVAGSNRRDGGLESTVTEPGGSGKVFGDKKVH